MRQHLVVGCFLSIHFTHDSSTHLAQLGGVRPGVKVALEKTGELLGFSWWNMEEAVPHLLVFSKRILWSEPARGLSCRQIWDELNILQIFKELVKLFRNILSSTRNPPKKE